MKRRVAVLVGLVVLIGGLLLFLVRTPAQETKLVPDESRATILKDPNFTESGLRALELAGIGRRGLVGQNWRGVDCQVHSYMLAPLNSDARPVFATRNLETDEMKVLNASDFDALMRRHISFEGGFVPVTFGQSEFDMYFWLGRMPDTGDSTHVYIRFDRTACGLVVDRIWYRGYPKGSEYVDVRIPVLP